MLTLDRTNLSIEQEYNILLYICKSIDMCVEFIFAYSVTKNSSQKYILKSSKKKKELTSSIYN